MFEANSGTVKNEIERLREIEYKVAFEQYNDGTRNHYYFALQATQQHYVSQKTGIIWKYPFQNHTAIILLRTLIEALKSHA